MLTFPISVSLDLDLISTWSEILGKSFLQLFSVAICQLLNFTDGAVTVKYHQKILFLRVRLETKTYSFLGCERCSLAADSVMNERHCVGYAWTFCLSCNFILSIASVV